MKKLACWLGLHDWVATFECGYGFDAVCRRCGAKKTVYYDFR